VELREILNGREVVAWMGLISDLLSAVTDCHGLEAYANVQKDGMISHTLLKSQPTYRNRVYSSLPL